MHMSLVCEDQIGSVRTSNIWSNFRVDFPGNEIVGFYKKTLLCDVESKIEVYSFLVKTKSLCVELPGSIFLLVSI